MTSNKIEGSVANQENDRALNVVTLKTLTAYQLLTYRENMLKLFGLLDDSEITGYFMDVERKRAVLDDMKAKLASLKGENPVE